MVKCVRSLTVRIGAKPHSGWLPAGAARPLATPICDILMDIEIQFDGYGYLLCYQARDGSVSDVLDLLDCAKLTREPL